MGRTWGAIRILPAVGLALCASGLRGKHPIAFPHSITPHNVDATATSRADPASGPALALLTGAGVLLAEVDQGGVRASHRDLRGRLTNRDAAGVLDHSTHVAGTLVGDGSGDPAARGVAPAARLDAFSWHLDGLELQEAAPYLSASNHAYGVAAGWGRAAACADQFSWYGGDDFEDPAFGKYTARAAAIDDLVWRTGLPTVWAAGNERVHTGALGGEAHYHFPDCATEHADGHAQEAELQFDLLNGDLAAKNTLVVGAVGNVVWGGSGPSEIVPLAFSAFGPTDDGRIKPELVAGGERVWSTTASADTSYLAFDGTSSAAAVVTGGVALLTELQRSLHAGRDLRAEALRALLVHTARRPSLEAPPDARTGFGLFDALAAAELLQQDAKLAAEGRLLLPGIIEAAAVEFGAGSVAAGTPLRVALTWLDPPGSVNVRAVDDATPALINDLDLSLVAPDGTVFRPWALDVAVPDGPAVRDAPNRVDTVEVVDVDAAANVWDGEWLVRVRAPAPLWRSRPQRFALVSSVPLDVQDAPLLEGPRNLLWEVDTGGGPGERTLSLANGGGGTLEFQLSEDVPWLALDATQGTAPAEVTLTLDPDALPAGAEHRALVHVDSTDPTGSQEIGVVVRRACTPDCSARECGPDPSCGVECGGCVAGTACTAAGTCAPWLAGCPAADLGSATSLVLTAGTTLGGGDGGSGSCGGAGAEDRAFSWTAPADGLYQVSTEGSLLEAVLHVRDGDCAGAELACGSAATARGAPLGLELAAGQQVTLFVDGVVGEGEFTLAVVPAACPEASLGRQVGSGLLVADNGPALDLLHGSCGGNGGREIALGWTALAAGRYTFSTGGSSIDTVLYLRQADCTGEELACADDGDSEAVAQDLAAGETVVIVVDSAAGDTGTMQLSITSEAGLCAFTCGDAPKGAGCSCDAYCVQAGDCCEDACSACGHCESACEPGQCGEGCNACASGERCEAGQCVPSECDAAAGCGAPLDCDGGTCADAGSPDAGAGPVVDADGGCACRVSPGDARPGSTGGLGLLGSALLALVVRSRRRARRRR